MRLAVLSDIHGNLAALGAVLDEVDGQGVDAVLNLGDILSGPLQPAETCDLLMERAFATIAGNHERQLLALEGDGEPDTSTSDGYAASTLRAAHWRWLRGLPAQLRLDRDVLLVHGTPASDLVYLMETVTPDAPQGIRAATKDEIRERLGGVQAALVLCGHSHVPRSVECGDMLVVNPGSVGVQAYDGEWPHAHRVEIGAPHARYAIVERARGRWTAQLRSVPYASEPQAALAQARGRAEWAHALRTGRMP